MANTQATSTGNGVNWHARSNQPESRAWRPLLAFFLFTIAITLTSYAVFLHYKESIKNDRQNELSGIADLKTKQIISWMGERKGDAQALRNDPLFVAEVERWLQQGGPAGAAKTKLIARLTSLQQAYVDYGYTSISLFDEHAMLRLSSSVDEKPILEMEKERLLESMRSGQIIFSDIHQKEVNSGEQIEIELWAPLTQVKNGKARSTGAILFRIDPDYFLFPLIQHWPTPSTSAENLLVRREGDEVVFLNESRNFKNSPLAMRFPLSQQQLPATMAAMGQEGLVEGVDYRGVPVISVLSKIAGTSWFMISKMDKAEIYAPINHLAYWMLALMLTLAGTGGWITIFWRQKERKQYEDKLEHLALANHLNYLAKYANDIILLFDGTGAIIDFNDRAIEAYGYTAAELSGINAAFLQAIDFTPPFAEKLNEIDLAGALRFESTHVRRNGAAFPVEASMRRIDVAGKKLYQSIIRDITEHKTYEETLRFHSEILKNLSEGIFLIRSNNGEIVYTNPQFEYMFGYDPGELFGKHVSIVNAPSENSPEAVANAINAALAKKGAWSGEVHNIRKDGTTFWCMASISAFEHSKFGKVWVSVHEDITEQKRADELLRKSEEHFRFLTENATDMTYLMSLPDGRYTYVSPSSKNLTGYTPEEFYKSPKLMQNIIHSGDHAYCEEQWEKLLAGEIPAYFEFQIIKKSGETRWMHQRNAPIWKEDGSNTLIAVQGVVTDITEQKQAAEQLQFSNALLTTAHETTLDGILVVDANGKILSFNRQFVNMWGIPDEIVESRSDERALQSILDKLVDPVRFLEKVRHLYTHPHETSHDEIFLLDGTILERYSAPMVGLQGKYYGRAWYFRDITERKQTENELARQKIFMWQIIDTDPNLIYVKDAAGKFLMVNQALANLYGMNIRNMIGKTDREIKSSPKWISAYLTADTEAFQDEHEVILTESSVMPDGKQHWYLTIKKPLPQANGSVNVLGIAVDITGQKLSEMKQAESYKELQRLTSHLENVKEDERTRIARELHDEMGATLAALKMRVSWLASKLPPELTLLSEETGHISDLVSDGIHTVRHIVRQLRPTLLEDVGLDAAITDYVRKFRQNTNIECTLALPEEGLTLEAEQSSAIFRILQESLSNIAKHAQASKVDILFIRRSNSLLMMVADNGLGFVQTRKEKSFGLLGIRERALIAGGKAKISSMYGEGTRVSVTVPAPYSEQSTQEYADNL
jgi:PAS domain S-box-containing protein